MLNRLEMLRIFCTAAESRNFKEAATRLGVSPQAVTRAVKDLEDHVGELLFHRNTRHNRITESGEQLAARARQSLQGVDAIFQRAGQARDSELAGLVRITAPRALGRHGLMRVLGELCAQHPGLQLDLRFSDQFADVVDEQIDIGIRVGVLRDSRFVARAVSRVSFHIVAAPELLARCGAPTTLQDLAERPTTVAIDPNTGRPWAWFLAGGQQWLPRTPLTVRKATPHKSIRILWGDASTLSVNFWPKGSLKCQVVPQHAKLPTPDAAEKMKAYWADKLEALRAFLEK
ncbi:MAG: LysR family transcriptional regulator [Thauera sp.]